MSKEVDIKDLRFELIEPELEGHKSVQVTFNYNGQERYYFIFIKEKKGVNYISEAKKQFEKDVRSGKAFETKFTKHRSWLIAGGSVLGAAALAVGGFFIWKNVINQRVHVVTFESNGGSHIETQRIKEGGTIAKPEDPAYKGYVFRGWYTTNPNPTPVGEQYDFNQKITSDITLYAYWRESEHAVKWLDYDGTVLKEEMCEDNTVPTYEDATHSTPTRKSDAFHDYTFTGWSPTPTNIHSDQTYVATYRTSFHEDTEAYMHINIADDNKDFTFTCNAKSNVTIDWGDGAPQESMSPGTISHTYTNVGEYSIRILSPITSISATNNTLIKELYLYKEITTIGRSAFSGCSKLQTVTFEDGSKLRSIGESAFQSCSSLTSITIPSGVTSINDYAFRDCSSLSSINIPSGVTSIKDLTFYNCSSLSSINIPSGVTSIGTSTFEKCSNLQTVTFGKESKLKTIALSAFYGCSSLTSITIPNGVTSIANSAFDNCPSLSSINIPSGITVINQAVFRRCYSLSSVIIHKRVTSIANSAFYICSNLQTVTFEYGSQLKSIGNNAFDSCSPLSSIIIPGGVTSIGEYAFYECSNLQTVDLTALSAVPTLGSRAFDYCPEDLKLYVKTDLVGAFKAADGWKEYANQITGDPIPSIK